MLALKAAPARVLVVAKAALGKGAATAWAQGGIAAAVGPDDSPRLHAQDTCAVAGEIAAADMVDLLTREAPERIAELVNLGMVFDRAADGDFSLGREAAHSRRRILHAGGDGTGAEMMRALIAAVRACPTVTVMENAVAENLLAEGGRVFGAMICHEGKRFPVCADATVLATGGIGQVYARTTNPTQATGDGLAMAARAGARLADVEFVQFHPTAIDVGVNPMPLATEALRGEGATLVDGRGVRFMPQVHELAELAPRDVVARAIWRRRQSGPVFLDARDAVGTVFPERFPTVWRHCRNAGIDPRVEPIPVAPAAHYHMGGVAVDGYGRTSLEGLWACGEVACTGVHGANRLASNSLLEAVVFAHRVAEDVSRTALAGVRVPEVPVYSGGSLPRDRRAVARIRRVMYEAAGLIRGEVRLTRALVLFGAIGREPLGLEACNQLVVARLIAAAALARRESRGGHFRADHPEAYKFFRERSLLTLDDADDLVATLDIRPQSRTMGARTERSRTMRG